MYLFLKLKENLTREQKDILAMYNPYIKDYVIIDLDTQEEENRQSIKSFSQYLKDNSRLYKEEYQFLNMIDYISLIYARALYLSNNNFPIFYESWLYTEDDAKRLDELLLAKSRIDDYKVDIIFSGGNKINPLMDIELSHSISSSVHIKNMLLETINNELVKYNNSGFIFKNYDKKPIEKEELMVFLDDTLYNHKYHRPKDISIIFGNPEDGYIKCNGFNNDTFKNNTEFYLELK